MNFSDHKLAVSRLETAQDLEKDMRDHSDEQHLFVESPNGQWEQQWYERNAGNPRYTFDVTNPIVDQIAGDIAEADFSIRVSPMGGDAKRDTASVYDGIIRNIQMQSGAKYTFNAAGKSMVIGGIDGWRVVQKYLTPTSFNQDLAIEPIKNFHRRVWFDPGAVEQDKSDARYCYVLHSVMSEDYKERWPKGKAQSLADGAQGSGSSTTKSGECVIVGEVLYGKDRAIEIAYMSNGATYTVNDDYKKVKDELALMGVTEKKRRKVKEKVWYSRFFDQSEWLEDEKETAFKSCPVIPELGNFAVIDGKQIYRGEVSRLMDPARVMNYSLSREIAEGALAPRSKLLLTQAQAEGHEAKLATMNVNQDPVLILNNDPSVPWPPMQTQGAQINPGLRNMSEAMRMIIGHVAGRFSASMGDNPGLQSGVAIESLQDRSDMSGQKYLECHAYALARTGKVLVEAIPTVYDTERQIRILNEDGTEEIVTINQTVVDQQTGKTVTLNDLGQGQYDVFCEAGPSFKNRQEQTLNFLLEMANKDPSVLAMGSDLVLNSLSFPQAKQLAERKRAQMLQQGLIPESQMTDEEKQQMQAAAQNRPPDPNMVLAQAEMEKAKAANTKAQVDLAAVQLKQAEIQLKAQELELEKMRLIADIQNMNQQTGIDGFNAQTKRLDTTIKANQSGTDPRIAHLDMQGKALDNAAKMRSLMTPDLPQAQ